MNRPSRRRGDPVSDPLELLRQALDGLLPEPLALALLDRLEAGR